MIDYSSIEVSIMKDLIENVAVKLLELAVIYLPKDVKEALRKAAEDEPSEVGRTQLKAILENIRLAEETKTPICQDTGTIIFYVEVGSEFKGLKYIREALVNATKKATQTVPLRPNAVDPFTGKNSGDNTGRYIPYIHWEIVEGDSLKLTAFPKGGGSENTCFCKMLSPGEGLRGLKRLLIDHIIAIGGMPCPPIIIGIGIGGGSDIAMKIAKKALLRPVGERNPDKEIAKLELELLEAVNMTGIGPMGLGGKYTALDVHIDYAHRHPASFPVAIATQCWAARRATAVIHSDGSVEFTTHEVEW